MPTEITLLSVVRKEFGSAKKIIVTANGSDGTPKELSAFQEPWNDGWQVGDTVSVVVRPREYSGKTYLNMYPTAKEANTARPPQQTVKTDSQKIGEIWTMLVNVQNMLKAREVAPTHRMALTKDNEVIGVPIAPVPYDKFDPDNAESAGGGHF